MAGVILAIGTQLLTSAVLPGLAGTVPTWSIIAVAPTVTMIGFFVARRLYRQTDQAFALISALTHTRWLGDILDTLSQALDQHGIDLVVKLPASDHTGQNQIFQLESLLKARRSFIGGFIVAEWPERFQRELSDFTRGIDRPVVFMDVRPFHDPSDYPERTAFVGCDPDEIGRTAAQWVAKELLEGGVKDPTILVVGAAAQLGRHMRFEARIREMIPGARIQLSLLGCFARAPARGIVDHYLRSLHRRSEHLDAIFCTNDEMALGALDAVQKYSAERRLDKFPLIVGVDGISEAIATIDSGVTPFRATIAQEPRRIAEIAVDALLRMRAGERVAKETFVPITVYPMD